MNIETGNIFLDWTGDIVTGADPNFGDWIYEVRVETRGRGSSPPSPPPILLSKVWIMRALDVIMSAPTSKLLVMKVKLYQIIEDTSAELLSLLSVNGSWLELDLRLEMTVQFSVCFYKIVPRLFRSCHETDTDEWRGGCWLVSISSDSIWKPPGRILCLVRTGVSTQISSLHFFKNQFCRRDFLAWSTALKYGDMDWFWFILCPATCRRLAIHHNRLAEVFSQSLEHFLRYNTSF